MTPGWIVTRGWIVVGAALDLVGAVLIARSVPEIGPGLVAGVGLLLAGSAAVFRGVLGLSRPQPEPAPAAGSAAGSGWKLEPELLAAPPRPVKLTWTGKLSAVLWGGMVLLVAGYVFLAPPRTASVPPLLEAEGIAGTATVHETTERETASGEAAYYVAYHFVTADGTQVRESRRVPRAVYDAVAAGDSFEVIYFPENPQQNFVARLDRKEMPASLRWMAAALLGALVFVFDQQRRVHRRLVSRGKAVAGVVEGVRRRGATRVYTVRYKLHAQEGRLRGSERNPERANGDVVTVLYMPERPEKVLLYCTSLYRARLP
ncbi:MAG: DUF3592 domain-containing protein [Bryobacterales bacterium]